MPTGAGGGGGGAALTFLSAGSFGGGNSSLSANTLTIFGFVNPTALKFASLSIYINNVDLSAAVYDLGVYTAAGVLVANIGPTGLGTSGKNNFTFLQGSKTIQPGLYVLAFTGNAATAAILDNTGVEIWVYASGYGTSSGGTLPATITAPTPGSPLYHSPWFSLF